MGHLVALPHRLIQSPLLKLATMLYRGLCERGVRMHLEICVSPSFLEFSVLLLSDHSLEDRRDALSFRFSISRTRIIVINITYQLSRPFIFIDVRSEAHMHSLWSPPTTTIGTLQPAHHTHHSRKVRSVCDEDEERLPQRLKRARPGCTS